MTDGSVRRTTDRRVLILFSATWPYGDGEQFLNDEMGRLAEVFDSIWVFPVNRIPEEMPQTGTVPGNVRVYPRPGREGRLAKLAYMTRDGGRMRRSAVRHEAATYATDLKKRAVLRFFEGKSFETLTHVLHVTESEGLIDGWVDGLGDDGRLRLVLYSYWYFVGCRVALDLRTYLAERLAERLTPEQIELLAVSRGHGYDLHAEEVSGNYLPYRAFFPRALDQSYPISEEGAKRLIDGCPDAADRITVARLGSCDSAGARRIAADPPTDPDTFHFVSCAYVRDVKRLDLLCQAFARLDDWLVTEGARDLAWTWTHIGGGPDFERLQAQAAKLLPPDRYRFTGPVPAEAVHAHYRTAPCDLYVNVSRNEGVPVAIMEAFSYGIPALATDVGGTSEIVRPGRSGHLLPPHPDAALITRRLGEAILRDPESRTRLRHSTRALWETLCDADRNYTAFARMLAGELPLDTPVPDTRAEEVPDA